MSTNPNIKAKEQQDSRVYSAEKLITAKYTAGKPTYGSFNVAAEVPSDAEYVIAFVTESQIKKGAEGLTGIPVKAEISAEIISVQGFKGAAKSTIVVPGTSAKVVLVGLGDVVDGVSSSKTGVTLDDIRQSLHVAIDSLRTLKAGSVAIVAPAVPVAFEGAVNLGCGLGVKKPKSDSTEATPVSFVKAVSAQDVAGVIARTAVTSNHTFDHYVKELSHVIGAFTLVSKDVTSDAISSDIQAAEAVLVARELGNLRADDLHPKAAREFAEKLVAAHPDVLSIRVVDYDECLSMGFNLITAVGQSAVNKPSIVCIEYKGDADQEAIALVGKYLTFDTGGLHLKIGMPSINPMYMDMLGGACVMGVMRYLAQTRPKTHIIGALAIAENAIDAASFKPCNIYPTVAGSVQIGNTDAEGRLALADTMTFVQDTYKPKQLIDIATLTGACIVALGDYAAGLFSNSNELAENLAKSGRYSNETLWRLPLFKGHHADLKGNQSDLSSIGNTPTAGSATAAAFLENFIQEGVEWAHLDIAGAGSSSAQKGHLPRGAVGFAVQTLIDYITRK